MVALRGNDINTFLARPDSTRPIVLLYGADAGLVRERAEQVVAAVVDDPKDQFAVMRMEGDAIAAEPSLLAEEATTIPMFGGRRAIRVRAGSKNIAGAVETIAGMTLKDCTVIIEAGEIRPESPLRKLCEKAKNAVAIACYPDTEKDLARLIEEELRLSSLRISNDARATLMSLLGGDRQASRNELRKLALYAHGTPEVTLEDVMTVVSDASDLKIDPIIDCAFAGNPVAVETEFNKAMIAGTNANMIMLMVQRQAALLHKASLNVAEGMAPGSAAESGFPRLHFSRKPLVEAALRNFTSARLAVLIEQLATAAFEVRKNAVLAPAIAQRALMSIAVNARRGGR